VRGSAYLMVIFLLFLAATALQIGLIARGILRTQREALRRTKAEYEGQVSVERTVYSGIREEGGDFVKRVEQVVKAQGGSVMVEEEVWARGEVPLSLFPDLELREVPPPEDFLAFLGKFKVEAREGHFILRGKRKALYFPHSVRIRVGRNLWIDERKYPKLPTIVDGDCLVEGSGSLYLLCAGRIYLKGKLKGAVVVSTGRGFLQEGSFQSWIRVTSGEYQGEILGGDVLFRGRGTFQGSLQALHAQGNWIHKKRGMVVEDFPKLYFLSYAFCYKEKKVVEVEK